jgi:prolyl-tRNA synthetase
LQVADIEHKVRNLLEQIQSNLYNKALNFREDNTHYADSWEEFTDIIENKGGFVYAHWDGTTETELAIKEKTKATIRLIPLKAKAEKGKCILSGKDSERRVLFARAY